jgi:translation elongation factor EF-1alpha
MEGTGDVVEVGFAETKIGEVSHFYPKISVAVIKPTGTLKVGDTVRITGKEGKINFTQKVESMEIEHEPIQEAKPGVPIGLQVIKKAPEGCCVFKFKE